MKNFLRALRYAWPYRRRLLLSVLCAFLAAVLWGLNLTSIYPVLKILHTEQSPLEWIDNCISARQAEIAQYDTDLDALAAEGRKLALLPPGKSVDQKERDLTLRMARVESKLQAARRSLYWYQFARPYVERWLPHDGYRTLVLVILVVLVGVILKCFFEFCQDSLVGSVVNLSLFDLRNRFYRNAIHLDVDQFGQHGSTELMARFTNDMESLGAGLKTLFGKVVAEPLRVLSCVVIACLISWQLTLMFLILVPVAAVILTRVGRIMKRATRRVLERMSSIYKILQESFQGIKVVKAYTMEPHERRRFFTATKDYYHKSMMVVNIDAIAGPIIEVLGVCAVAAALLAGSYLVLMKQTALFGMQMSAQPMEAETLLQLYILLAAIADPVRKLSSVFTRIQSGGAAADRIFAFLDRTPRVTANSECPRLVRTGGNEACVERPDEPLPRAPRSREHYIEFRDVCFSYEADRSILTNINFSVRAGETIAVVGPNGSGKTTLLSLLPRFFDPDHGSILIDGHDLRAIHLRSLRQQIGVVTQMPVLFDDTVFNNIAYGAKAATREQVEEAARRAFAHDFIVNELKRGYDSTPGELGNSKVSGGQMQRIALARAILRDPSILILDEFTSQTDPESEATINRAMKEFMVGRTSFVITHKLNTLQMADRILVLDGGRVAGLGTHSELLASCGVYQRLHDANSQRLVA